MALLNQKFYRRITPEFLYLKERAAEKSTFIYSFSLFFFFDLQKSTEVYTYTKKSVFPRDFFSLKSSSRNRSLVCRQ